MRSQANALRLAATEGARTAVQGEVIKAYIVEELQARHDFLQHLAGNKLLALGKLKISKKVQAIAHGERGDLANIFAAD